MKKLSKKNQTILDNLRKALDTSTRVLKDFHDEDNYNMVRHMQRDVESMIDGIVTYLIYSDLKAWNALEVYVDEIKARPEYQSEYAWECNN